MKKVLRDYQVEIVRKLSHAYMVEGHKAVIMQMVTGAGKTRTADFVVQKYTSSGRQVLWLVHREELMLQASMVFAESELEHGLICSSSSENAIKVRHAMEFGKSFIRSNLSGVQLFVASVPTLVRRLDKVPFLHPDQIIADECHLSLAETWTKVIGAWPDARLLGLSATPSRLDKRPFARTLGGLYDKIIKGPPMSMLIESGNLAKYKFYTPPVKFKDVSLHKKGGDWDSHDLEEELSDPVIYGDVIAHYERLSKGKPAIAFCPTVSSAEKFAEAFREAGYKAISLDGNTDDNIRRDSLAQLGRGDIDVIFSVSILIEGTDVPYACTAMLLRRTESLVIYLQSIGRVLRPHPDKEYAIILDFVGNWQTHGWPDEDREWNLEGEVKNKPDFEIKKVAIRVCLKCGHVHEPLPVCPDCGFVYPVNYRREMKQDKKGELIELKRQEKVATEVKRKEARIERGKARTLEDLERIELIRGYKKGWARMVYQARKAKGLVH